MSKVVNKNTRYSRRARAARKAAGLCVDCGLPKGEDVVILRCPPCAKRASVSGARWRKANPNQSPVGAPQLRCARCAVPLPTHETHKLCSECRDYQTERASRPASLQELLG